MARSIPIYCHSENNKGIWKARNILQKSIYIFSSRQYEILDDGKRARNDNFDKSCPFMKIDIWPIAVSQVYSYVHLFQAEGLLFSDKCNFFGAFYDDKMVGICGLLGATLKCDYVFPEYRHRGIGTEMVKFRLVLLHDAGRKRAYAHCMPASRGIYLRCGGMIKKEYRNGIALIELRP